MVDHTRIGQWYRRAPVAFIAAAALIVFLIIWIIRSMTGVGGGLIPFGGPRFQIVGFYENSTTGSLASLKTHYASMTQLSPRWFSVTATGSIKNVGYQPSVAAFVRTHHLKLLPLVTNLGSGMLDSASLRATAAGNVATLVRQDHFSGVSLDFELLPPSARTPYSAFVADVRKDLGSRATIAVSVFPLVGVPSSITAAYDYAALARSASYLVLMTYDRHSDGSTPGPVAPYGWVAASVNAALKAVPAHKIVLAIGTYGYDWPNTGTAAAATTVSDVQAKALAHSYGITPKYDQTNSQNYFTYASSSGQRVVWYMGDRSASARVALARSKHLLGVAIWELGDEDPAFWKTLKTP